MRVLLTGATGYIGQQLLRRLLEQGHQVVCCVRNPDHFNFPPKYADQVEVFKVDFVALTVGLELPGKFDLAYYLIHSMSASTDSFGSMEQKAAENFLKLSQGKGFKQVIYLSGISNEDKLSKHLESRLEVENILRSGETPVTVLRAGIIVGAGSASFELIRDLVEKLPVMITPKWLLTRCQPISIHNVLQFLTGIALREKSFGKSYDIGSEDILTYKEMLEIYAEVRGLGRKIWTVPVMTPRLSSYWLYFVTTVSYPLAVNLVNSMKVEIVCKPNNLAEDLGIDLVPYREAVEYALKLYGEGAVFASWKDALSSSYPGSGLEGYTSVPSHGTFKDERIKDITGKRESAIANIWAIGGNRGWYYGNWLWKMRGFMDKLFGGVGLRRGRTNDTTLSPGDALDFWRVLAADKSEGRLLLFAEMKLPGEAWLEFRIKKKGEKLFLSQTATFRPKGLMGRLYWYLVLPFHFFVFEGMIKGILDFQAKESNSPQPKLKTDSI